MFRLQQVEPRQPGEDWGQLLQPQPAPVRAPAHLQQPAHHLQRRLQQAHRLRRVRVHRHLPVQAHQAQRHLNYDNSTF